MNIPVDRSTLTLTHIGRRSGKSFQVTIWFTVIDGCLWIGSLDENRNWVRNLRAAGKAVVDLGEGPVEVAAEFLDRDADRNRYRDAVTSKYPLLSRLIAVFGWGKKRAVFRLNAA